MQFQNQLKWSCRSLLTNQINGNAPMIFCTRHFNCDPSLLHYEWFLGSRLGKIYSLELCIRPRPPHLGLPHQKIPLRWRSWYVGLGVGVNIQTRIPIQCQCHERVENGEEEKTTGESGRGEKGINSSVMRNDMKELSNRFARTTHGSVRSDLSADDIRLNLRISILSPPTLATLQRKCDNDIPA